MEEFFKQLTKQIKDCEKIIFMTHQNMDLDGFASILDNIFSVVSIYPPFISCEFGLW